MNHEQYLQDFLSEIDERGYLKHREGKKIEFKKSFSFGSMGRYSRTIAAFANAEGGYLIFGVKNRPRQLVGIDKEKFDNLDPVKITIFLNEHFSPEIKWEMGIIDLDIEGEQKKFGFIYVHSAEQKPIVCKKQTDSGELREGAIYYRYRGQSKEIRYEELNLIIQESINKERRKWMRLLERIAAAGIDNVAILDLTRQDLTFYKGNEKRVILIDKDVVDQLKEKVMFIEEGKFSEKEGEPTLRLVGNVQPIDFDPNKTHPYSYKSMAEEISQQLGITIRQYDVQALVERLELKKSSKYHLEARGIHMFSDRAKHQIVSYLQKQIQDSQNMESFLCGLRKEYFSKIRNR